MSDQISQYLNIRSANCPVWLSDGQSIAFLSDITGVPQIWRVSDSGGYPEQLTSFDQRISAIYRLPPGLGLAFTMDVGGDERNQLWQLLPDGRTAINLTDNPQAVHQFGGAVAGECALIITSNARDAAHFDVYRLDLHSRRQCLLLRNDDHYNIPAALSPDGRYFLYNKLQGRSNNLLWMLDLATGSSRQVPSGATRAAYLSPVWKPDSSGFYLLTDQGSEFIHLAFYRLADDRLEAIYRANWDLECLALSCDGRYLAFTINQDGYSLLQVKDLQSGDFLQLPSLPAGVINSHVAMDWSPVGHRLAFGLSSAKAASDIWVLDLEAKRTRQLTFSSRGGIPADGFVQPELIRFASFDGLSVPAWVFRPQSSAAQPLPAVIRIHGGPEGQERPAFNPVTQYLVNRGFVVVEPNVRGSTGYGSAYHHLDDVEKRLDSVKDIAALVDWLVRKKTADSARIAVMGASYGGFMTLACITNYPELWAAAVDVVGIANFETFMEHTDAYRRTHRASEYGSLEQHRHILRQVSPIHQVDRIACPLLVVHGANDPRVPIGEAEQIVESLRKRQHPVAFLRYEDEGHGIIRLANRLDCYSQVATFLHQHLGGESLRRDG